MKKMFLGIIIGLSIVGVVYAAEILMDAKNISYSSEYTESDNVADVLSELLELPGARKMQVAATLNYPKGNYTLSTNVPVAKGNKVYLIIGTAPGSACMHRVDGMSTMNDGFLISNATSVNVLYSTYGLSGSAMCSYTVILEVEKDSDVEVLNLKTVAMVNYYDNNHTYKILTI